MSTSTNFSIAAVERETRLSKDVLRVWERRYGFPQPVRDANGERCYPAEQVDRLRLMRPGEGVRLKAFVVPRPGAGAAASFTQELRNWIDARLAAPERPKAITLGERIPRGALGKPADWSIGAR